MNRILNKTTLFIFVVLLNVGFLLYWAGSLDRESDTLPDYTPAVREDLDIHQNMRFHRVQVEDVERIASYNADLRYRDVDQAYSTYTVDDKDTLFIGERIDAAQTLGMHAGSPTDATVAGRIVNIQPIDDHYDIVVLNENAFEVEVYIDQDDYYTHDYTDPDAELYFLLSDAHRLPIQFDRTDYAHGVVNGAVRLFFTIEDPDLSILPGATGAVHHVLGTYESVYTISADAFPGSTNNRNFFVLDEDDSVDGFETIRVSRIDETHDRAIIESDYPLEGVRLYDLP